MQFKLFLFSFLIVFSIHGAKQKPLGEILTPAQKNEYNSIRSQLHNHLMLLPANQRSNDAMDKYIKKIGTPIAFRLLDDLKKSDKLFNEGYALMPSGKYKEAADKFTGSILIDDSFPDVWEKRAECYFYMYNYSQAMNDYNRCICLNPKNGAYYMYRGLCYGGLGDSNNATLDIRFAAQLGCAEAQVMVNAIDAESRLRSQKELAENKKKTTAALEARFGFKPGTLQVYAN